MVEILCICRANHYSLGLDRGPINLGMGRQPPPNVSRECMILPRKKTEKKKAPLAHLSFAQSQQVSC